MYSLSSTVRRAWPSTTKSTPSAPGSSSGLSLPPPGATSTMYCENVSAKPDSGRASTQSRVSSQNGRKLVTMSRITPRGMTAYDSVNIARSVSSSLCEGWPPCGA